MHNKFVFLLFITFGFSFFSYSQEKPDSLKNFLIKKRNYNKTSRNGYSVILYNGNEDGALKMRHEFMDNFKDIAIKLTYVSPDWKIITPAYSTKIEAERVFLIIKEKYPNAKIL